MGSVRKDFPAQFSQCFLDERAAIEQLRSSRELREATISLQRINELSQVGFSVGDDTPVPKVGSHLRPVL